MVQVPVARSVTVLPDTVQTLVVKLLKLTPSPDDAEALTEKGVSVVVLLPSAAKEIDWLALFTVRYTSVIAVL